MVADSNPTVFAVSEPFDRDPDADLELRSSDNFQFQVRKAILSFASPGLRDMLHTTRPLSTEEPEHDHPSPDEPSLQSTQLSEKGSVIDVLLRYCYPVAPPHGIDNFDTFVAVRSTAEKYKMTVATTKVDSYIKEAHADDVVYRLYYYRYAYEHQVEAKLRSYAYDCLNFPLSSLVSHRQENSSNNALLDLINYRHDVCTYVASYIADFVKIKDATVGLWKKCGTYCIQKGKFPGIFEPKWWRNIVASTIINIYKEGPTSKHILPSQPNHQHLCTECQSHMFVNRSTLEGKIYKIIEEKAKEVEFVLPC